MSRLLSICYDEGPVTKVLIVYDSNGTKIINTFYDQEAEELYKKLIKKFD